MITQKLPSANSAMLTISTTAISLRDAIRAADAPTSSNFNFIDGANFADLKVETESIRYLIDGNVPTASDGTLAEADSVIPLYPVDLSKVMLIRAGGSDAIVTVVRSGKIKAGEI